MFIRELFEDTQDPTTIVILPGRFQPWHKGHHAVYNNLVTKYGRDQVFVVSSNKVELPKSPFNFSDKTQFMALTGVPMDKVVESKQPYKAEEVTRNFDPTSTRLIFAVSEKDMADDPRFKSWTKKDGSPAYFQPMPTDTSMMESFDKHGYIKTVPTVDFTVLGQPMRSATEIRAQFAQADLETQKAIVRDLFGKYDEAVLRLMQQKLRQQT
jgi:hypothetical protein